MSDVEETLSREAEQRPRIATIALLGGLLSIAGSILFTILINGGPTEKDGFISLTEALGASLAGGAAEGDSLIVRQVDYYGDNVAPLIASAVLTAGAGICAGLVLLHLYRAINARNPAFGRIPLFAAVTGLVMYPIGHLVFFIATWTGAASFQDASERNAGTAREALTSSASAAGELFEGLGKLALAAGLVLIALHAMRIGLLTRFLGVLGIIAGVLWVFPLDQPGIIRAFWLVSVGLLLAGRTRTGLPRAWQTGRAEPWPTRQQALEQRQAAAGTGGASAAPAAPATQSAPAQRRKRKRRR